MKNLIKITNEKNIFSEYKNTPIDELLQYHNLNRSFENYNSAQMLICMCMDHRKHLRIPNNFSYIIRTGGANIKQIEFMASYAMAIGSIKHIAIIGHSNCGMVNVESKKDAFIKGLVENAGCDEKAAKELFSNSSRLFGITNEIDFILEEAKELRIKYPKITIVPMYYKLEDDLLYLIDEKHNN